MHLTRRQFVATCAAGAAAAALPPRSTHAAPRGFPELAGQIGVTTSSVDAHFSPTNETGKLALLDLPRFLRDELGMTVIDLNTRSLGTHDRHVIEAFRAAAEKAGTPIVNLKMNQKRADESQYDMASPDAATREEAMAEYRRSIDDAAILGCPYARPLPTQHKPELERHVAAYRELADYASPKGVRMMIENYLWMEDDPDLVPKLVSMIGHDVAVSPDTGNWANNEVRYIGLERAFPFAVTCDFKAKTLGPNGEHEMYDLKRCFDVGWASGFRGPWCIEHANGQRDQLVRELTMVRDMLAGWIKDKGQA